VAQRRIRCSEKYCIAGQAVRQVTGKPAEGEELKATFGLSGWYLDSEIPHGAAMTSGDDYQAQVQRGLEAARVWLAAELPGSEITTFLDPELPSLLYVVHVGIGSKLPRIVKFRESFLADNHAAMSDALEEAGLLRRLDDTAGPIVIPADTP
jgi:hypothetical protein